MHPIDMPSLSRPISECAMDLKAPSHNAVGEAVHSFPVSLLFTASVMIVISSAEISPRMEASTAFKNLSSFILFVLLI